VRHRTSNDVFAAAVPSDIDPSDEAQAAQVLTFLDETARAWVWSQWLATGERPLDIEFAASEWLVTRDVWRVDEFQPAHDCQECRSGNDKCKAFLRANPGSWVAMANLTYVEVWP
jgi:hypothetical protein